MEQFRPLPFFRARKGINFIYINFNLISPRKYRKIAIIVTGIIFVQKAFLVGLLQERVLCFKNVWLIWLGNDFQFDKFHMELYNTRITQAKLSTKFHKSSYCNDRHNITGCGLIIGRGYRYRWCAGYDRDAC